jgi:hypothetical protein
MAAAASQVVIVGSRHRAKETNKVYALRSASIKGGSRKKQIFMHRLIMGYPRSQVDHRDGDGCNNQKENLRIAGTAENAWNTGSRKTNTSGCKGVYWYAQTNKWENSD